MFAAVAVLNTSVIVTGVRAGVVSTALSLPAFLILFQKHRHFLHRCLLELYMLNQKLVHTNILMDIDVSGSAIFPFVVGFSIYNLIFFHSEVP